MSSPAPAAPAAVGRALGPQPPHSRGGAFLAHLRCLRRQGSPAPPLLRAVPIAQPSLLACAAAEKRPSPLAAFPSRAGRGGAVTPSAFAPARPFSGSATPAGSMAESSATSASATSAGPTAGEALPEVMTEFMVEMSCQGCVKNVRRNLEPVEGVSELTIALEDKVVRVTGTSSLLQLEEALKKTGLRSRLIGQGDPEKLELTAAVAEFKGPKVFGVVRFTQVNMDVARVEAQFDGLSPQSQHTWAVNEFGDLTNVPESTGSTFNPAAEERPAGKLGNLDADESGHASSSSASEKLKVWDLIGRAVVVYQGPEGAEGEGLCAAVVARSAGVGQNYKSICSCDGTVIWEATNSDFVSQKV